MAGDAPCLQTGHCPLRRAMNYMKSNKLVGLLCIATLGLVQPLTAKDKPAKHNKPAEFSTETFTQNATLKLQGVLSDDERRIIRSYVDSYSVPGKGQKQRALPPGL